MAPKRKAPMAAARAAKKPKMAPPGAKGGNKASKDKASSSRQKAVAFELSSEQISRRSVIAGLSKATLLKYAHFLGVDESKESTNAAIATAVLQRELEDLAKSRPTREQILQGDFDPVPPPSEVESSSEEESDDDNIYKEPPSKSPAPKASRGGSKVKSSPHTGFSGGGEGRRQCQSCHELVDASAAHCTSCGGSMAAQTSDESWSCPAPCGKSNTTKFCASCGASSGFRCCGTLVKSPFCGTCGKDRRAQGGREEGRQLPPGVPSPNLLLSSSSLSAHTWEGDSLGPTDAFEKQLWERLSVSQRDTLMRVARKTRFDLRSLAYVPSERLRERLLQEVHQEAYSKGNTFSVSEGGQLSISAGTAKVKPISSEADFLTCLQHRNLVESILIPAKAAMNLQDLATITSLLERGCSWESVFAWSERARIANAGKMASLGQPEGTDMISLLAGINARSVRTTPHPGAGAPLRPTKPGQPLKPRPIKETGRNTGTIPEEIAQSVRTKGFCMAFQKGTCNKGPSHTIERKGKTSITVAHKCATCDEPAHGALTCPKRG